MTELIQKIADIQNELRVPKKKNSGVPYKSRNAEEILDQVKPLLLKHGLIVTLEPELQEIGGRLFIVSTATVTDGTDKVSGRGIAELMSGNRGMNEAQASGATGSYANKYALGAVFGIGEAEDADHERYQPSDSYVPAKAVPGKVSDKQVGLIEVLRNKLKTGDPKGYELFGQWYKTTYENKPFKQLSKGEASLVIDRLNDNTQDDGLLPIGDDLEEYSGEIF